MNTVLCVSTHPEDLADGRIISPGETLENVAVDVPHNTRLVEEGRLVVLDTGDEPVRLADASDTELHAAVAASTVKDVLAQVGDDKELAVRVLDAEKAGKARSTVMEPLEALASSGDTPDEEVSL